MLISLREKMTITWNDLAIGTLAEFFMEIARILVSYSVEKGLAGPAAALISTQALHQALLGVIFADQSLGLL